MRRFFYTVSSDDNNDSNRNDRPQLSSLSIGSEVELPDSIVHHWCRVLRANIGDQGILFDGLGGEYQVQLQTISKKHATATLLAHESDDRNAPIISKVGLVMSRGERMDYGIQKATELGVTAIQLLSSQHGEVNLKPAQVDKKLQHWQQIAIAACEQCGLNRPPLILSPESISQWLKPIPLKIATDMVNDVIVSPIMVALSRDPYYQALDRPADLRLMMSVPAAGHPLMPVALSTVLAQDRPYIELLIGPEGGLSDEECRQAQDVGFVSWQIGTRVLRTETAGIAAISVMQAFCGDFARY